MKYQEASKICANCGKEIFRLPSEGLSNFKRNKTCSKECRYSRLTLNNLLVDDHGYLRFTNTRIRLHRYVMEQHLGRKLLSSEEVHHIDENKLNNDIANLEVLSKAEHTSKSFKGKKRAGLRGRLV